MSIAAYLREIARGKDGARALDAAQAEDLLRRVFEGQVSDVQLGAFVIAMRIKGESAAELAGFVAAAQAHLAPAIAAAARRSPRPVLWLPSYNGARKLPNLTPLLAALLARQGWAVLVHGRAEDAARVTSHAVFAALGWPIAATAAGIEAAWAARQPVFVTTETLCPPLARLLDVRQQTGLRNPGHTVAKLLALAAQPALPQSQAQPALPQPQAQPSLPQPQAQPSLPQPQAQPSLRVVNHTHPEYAVSLAQFLAESRADALLLRGTEGEPVADARRTPRMDAFVAGRRIEALGVAAQGGVLTRVAALPAAIDAATTAGFIDAALADPAAVPLPIRVQVAAIEALRRAIAQPLERAA